MPDTEGIKLELSPSFLFIPQQKVTQRSRWRSQEYIFITFRGSKSIYYLTFRKLKKHFLPCSAVWWLSGVHLVDSNDQLLDTEGVGEQSMLSGLTVLGDTGLELTSSFKQTFLHNVQGLKCTKYPCKWSSQINASLCPL